MITQQIQKTLAQILLVLWILFSGIIVAQAPFKLKFDTNTGDGSLITHQMKNGDFLVSAWTGDWPLLLKISEDGNTVDTIQTIGFPRYFKFTNIVDYNQKVVLSGVQMDSYTKKDSLIFIYMDTVIDFQNAYKLAIFDSIYGCFEHLNVINNRLMYSGYYILFNNIVESMLAELDSNFNLIHYNDNLVMAFNDDSIGYSQTTVVQPSNIQYCFSDSSFYVVADIKPSSYEAYLIRLNDTLGVDSIYVFPLTFFSQPLQLLIQDSFFLVSSRSVPVGIPSRICSYIVFDHLHNKIVDSLIGTSVLPAYPSAFTNLSLVDSHFIFYGYTENYSNNYYGQSQSSFTLCKMDLLGDVLYKKEIFDSINYVLLYGIQTTRDGGCLLNGDSYNYSEQNYEKDIFIVKVDSSGQVTWAHSIISKTTKVKIFPNPASEQLHISITAPDETIEIVQLLDLQGKVVMQKKLNTAAAQLDIQNLPAGAYLLRGYTKSGKSFSGKVVKQ